MIQDKTLSAENACSLFKDGEATAPRLWLPVSLYLLRPCSRARAPDLRPVGHNLLNHLASSLRASREGVVRGVASGRLLLVHLLVRTRHYRRGAPCGQPPTLNPLLSP